MIWRPSDGTKCFHSVEVLTEVKKMRPAHSLSWNIGEEFPILGAIVPSKQSIRAHPSLMHTLLHLE